LYTKLSDAKLKTGENMEVGVILAPDGDFIDEMPKVLHHKGEPWLSHVSRALSGDIKGLETRFYVGQLDGHVVGNIMTVEYNHTGILGHVFTIPEQRRKHICSLIMAQQMADFRQRGGGILLLGTGYNSHPYWIYHSYGFRSLIEGSGFMRFSTDDDFEAKFFAKANANVVDVEWKHWPAMNLLTSRHEIGVLRSLSLGSYGVSSFEGGFLHFMKRIEDRQIKAKLLESESGAVVGCIMLDQDRRWTSKTYILDMFVHPNFVPYYPELINSMELPDGKIQCYVDSRSPINKMKSLEEAGFRQEALLKSQFIYNSEWLDVFVYSKFCETLDD